MMSLVKDIQAKSIKAGVIIMVILKFYLYIPVAIKVIDLKMLKN